MSLTFFVLVIVIGIVSFIGIFHMSHDTQVGSAKLSKLTNSASGVEQYIARLESEVNRLAIEKQKHDTDVMTARLNNPPDEQSNEKGPDSEIAEAESGSSEM